MGKRLILVDTRNRTYQLDRKCLETLKKLGLIVVWREKGSISPKEIVFIVIY